MWWAWSLAHLSVTVDALPGVALKLRGHLHHPAQRRAVKRGDVTYTVKVAERMPTRV